MNFKIKKISKKPAKVKKIPKPKKLNGHKAKKYSISFSIIVSLLIITILSIGIVKAVTSIDVAVFLEVAGEELKTDAFGHTNFLVLGTGGENHDGGDLTDTIIVASLDNENKLVTMISIPRDLYVKNEEITDSKINEIYFNAKNTYESSKEGLEYMQKKVEEIAGVPIHYWVKLDFKGFKEFIDALGGIDVYVEQAIYDPYYPKDGTILFEPFSISEGQHHLDGETALKYARSRKTTSDFDRARRQQQIIYAVKEKALQTEIIFSQERITEILNSFSENIETNLKVKEILTLGSFASDFSEENISHRLIHDDPNQCGGFLYTPAREFYGGMFVLIPAGGFEFLHWYADLNFNSPLIAGEESRLHILNGTRVDGVAGEAKQILQRYCFDVVRFGNAIDKTEQTFYYYQQKYNEAGEQIPSRPETIDFLQKLIPGVESTEIPENYKEHFPEASILMVIGADYANSENYVDDPFYYLPAIVTTPTETETSE